MQNTVLYLQFPAIRRNPDGGIFHKTDLYKMSCAGSSRPQTFFEEAELENTDDFIRMKHSKDFKEFAKETLPTGQIIYKYDNGSIMYSYEFTEL